MVKQALIFVSKNNMLSPLTFLDDNITQSRLDEKGNFNSKKVFKLTQANNSNSKAGSTFL